jgi:hypothetical protein
MQWHSSRVCLRARCWHFMNHGPHSEGRTANARLRTCRRAQFTTLMRRPCVQVCDFLSDAVTMEAAACALAWAVSRAPWASPGDARVECDRRAGQLALPAEQLHLIASRLPPIAPPHGLAKTVSAYPLFLHQSIVAGAVRNEACGSVLALHHLDGGPGFDEIVAPCIGALSQSLVRFTSALEQKPFAVQKLCAALEAHAQLTRLELRECYGEVDDGESYLARLLRKLLQLRALVLHECAFTGPAWDVLGVALGGLAHLTTLAVVMPEMGFSPTSTAPVAAVAHARHLRELLLARTPDQDRILGEVSAEGLVHLSVLTCAADQPVRRVQDQWAGPVAHRSGAVDADRPAGARARRQCAADVPARLQLARQRSLPRARADQALAAAQPGLGQRDLLALRGIHRGMRLSSVSWRVATPHRHVPGKEAPQRASLPVSKSP